MFWIYFNEDKDVFIPKHLQSRLHQYSVFVRNLSEKSSLTIDQYLQVLHDIRHELVPFVQDIQPLYSLAHEHANQIIQQESDDIYSDFDTEQTAEKKYLLAKQKLQTLLQEKVFLNHQRYDSKSFKAKYLNIASSWNQPGYTDLILFAVLGIHHFRDSKKVFSSFTEEQLKEKLEFSLESGFPKSFSLTLKDFLVIIEQLNFKKHLFTI